MDWTLIPVFLLLGCLAGFVAGLLGIGGGMTMVPFLTMIFTFERFPPQHVVHMAVATSTATIIFTSIASVRAHHKHGAVQWPIVWRLAPGIVVGSLIGPLFASGIPTSALAATFGVFTCFSATQMILDRKPKPSRVLPGTAGMSGVGMVIGFISALVGAGGGFLTVPFLTWCNVKIHNAVATSAALGLPIAIAGTIGFIIAGLRQTGMPALSAGYIYIPALVGIVITSVLLAPVGARTAHRWPVKKLKRAFALLLYALSAYMFYKAFRA